MNILGISCYYHDAAAALVQDGQLVAAAEEERFNRKKHDPGFPKLAIEYCLAEAGITREQVDHVVFYEKPFVKFDRILNMYTFTWPHSMVSFLKAIPLWLKDRLWMRNDIQKNLEMEEKEILFAEHHMSHAASAFLVSPFEKAAILTLDGVGEWATTGRGYGEGNQIHLEEQISFPHSIGLLYSAITSYLGFRVNDAEWKVMGLAPYGEPKYVEQFAELIDMKPDGSFRLNMKYFAHHWSSKRMFNRRFERLFGRPQRLPESELEDFHRDIAHSGQKIVERIIVNLARATHEKYGIDDLCIAGGVGLNSVANWRILKETPFKRVWIQPAAGDSGGAVGAAFFVWNVLLGNPRTYEMKHAYLGPQYSDDECEAVLKARNIPYEKYDRDALVKESAKQVAESKVIGWYQGRMEFGPRALGSRSIIANPMNPEMKDIINAKIKFREKFRPFAPAVLLDRAHEFFEMDEGLELPYMLMVPKVRAEVRDKIPAVTHEDGTGRVQTVTRRDNALYYDMIEEFGKHSGVPVVVNTSFNVRGEPIVNTPENALNCFLKTGMDVLVLGNCIVDKSRIEGDLV